MEKKESEKKPLSWEVADPKLPVIRSGHFENRKENITLPHDPFPN